MTPSREFAWSTKDGKFHRSKKPMATNEELMKAVTHRSEQGDACYQSVYEFDDFDKRDTAIIKCIYLDFDKKDNPQTALDEAARVVQHIGERTIQYFSGFKGVGVLIECDAVPLLPEMKSASLRRWTFDLIDDLNLKTCDHAVIGDINRVHRVIDTRHQETELYAIGLTRSELSDLTIEEVKALATSPRGLVQDATPSPMITEQLLHIEETILIDRLHRFVGRKMLAQTTFNSIVENMTIDSRNTVFEFIQSLDDEYQYRVAKNAPRSGFKNWWIVEAEEKLRSAGQLTDGKDRGLEHKKRVHFVKFAHRCGMSFSEICNAFVNVVDGNGKRCYDAAITKSQVRSCIR